MSYIAHLLEAKLAFVFVESEFHMSGSVQHFSQVLLVFHSILAYDDDVIDNYSAWISSEYLFHGSLENFRGRVDPKGHPQELKPAERSSKCCVEIHFGLLEKETKELLFRFALHGQRLDDVS